MVGLVRDLFKHVLKQGLPLVMSKQARETESDARAKDSILVVEDEERVRKLLSMVLRRAGYDVTVAADGRAALRRIAEATPDLVVSDVMMPEMDGFTLLRELRTDPATRAIPVILLTAKSATTDVVEGFNLGADDYLPKPFEAVELLARVKAKIERPPVPSDQLILDRQTGLLSERHFREELKRESERSARSGMTGCLAYLFLHELPTLRDSLGSRSEAALAKQVTELVQADNRPLDIVGRDRKGRFIILLPETGPDMAQRRLDALAQQIAKATFMVGGERLRLTPTIGYTSFKPDLSPQALRDKALRGLDQSAARLDLRAVRDDAAPPAGPHRAVPRTTRRERLHRWLDTPLQIAIVLGYAFVMPFVIYALLAALGADITHYMYAVVVFTLVLTAYLIWVEGFMALRLEEPTIEQDAPAGRSMLRRSVPYEPAAAIIAAYLPNEAATIVETIEAFLRIEYPGSFQVILAYNTPRDLPVETTLREIAAAHPWFVPLRVEGSTSKAQNVNAALAMVKCPYVGIFDADHHPMPDCFSRAWRWLSTGYDIVQGHCLVRNGDQTWVSRMVAVEFEAIYAVSHPGRARLHDFAIFGGANGYWKTELLRQTRMHGFMLTEDIDSSMRVLQAGYKIKCDPLLVSRELGPVTVKALWNQRMRWAQGWFQVSVKHALLALWSPKLTLRQKAGIFHLLVWREAYPFLSFQMFPILALWIWQRASFTRLDWLVPILVLTTLFTLSTGPGQTMFAYLLAAPEIRKHKRWFLFYLLVSSLFFTPLKNLVTMVAQVKELMGDRKWSITPRTAAAAPTCAEPAEAVS